MSQPWDISIAQGAGGPVRLAGKASGQPSGGGSSAVSVALQGDPIDVHDAGAHVVPWNVAYDNFYAYNDLMGVLPAGLGLNIPLDGIDATITATEAGIWLFEFAVRFAIDATALGNFGWLGGGLASTVSPQWDASTAASFTVSDQLVLPSGAVNFAKIGTDVEATADPYLTASNPFLSIIRIA